MSLAGEWWEILLKELLDNDSRIIVRWLSDDISRLMIGDVMEEIISYITRGMLDFTTK